MRRGTCLSARRLEVVFLLSFCALCFDTRGASDAEVIDVQAKHAFVGRRVFLKKAAVLQGKRMGAGSLARIVDLEVEQEGNVALSVAGMSIEAPVSQVQLLAPLEPGMHVEIHTAADHKQAELNLLRGKAGVLTEVGDTLATVTYEGLFRARLPLAQLVPACFARGTRASTGVANKHGQYPCICEAPYTGFHCLSTATKDGDGGVLQALVSGLRSLLGRRKSSTSKRAAAAAVPEPLYAARLVWEGFRYNSIVTAPSKHFSDIIHTAVFTLVIACNQWEPLCSIALDTVGRVELDALVELSKDRQVEEECRSGEDIPVADSVFRKLWADSRDFSADGAIEDTGPRIVLFSKYSTGPLGEYVGSLNDPGALHAFVLSVIEGTPTLTSPKEVDSFLGDNHVALIVSPAGFDEDALRRIAADEGMALAFAEPPLHACAACIPVGEGDATAAAALHASVYARLGDGQRWRRAYAGARGEVPLAEWVRAEAGAVVTPLTHRNFDKEVEAVRAAAGAMVVALDAEAHGGELWETAVQARLAGEALRFYTLDVEQHSELVRRCGFASFMVLAPAAPACAWTDAAPRTLAEASVLDYAADVPSHVLHGRKELPQDTPDTGVVRLTELTVRQLWADCAVDSACCGRAGDCRGCPKEQAGSSSRRRVLLAVRTEWCWHCRAVLPTLKALAASVNGSDILVAETVLSPGTALPPWLEQHVEGYPELLLVERPADAGCAAASWTVRRYEGGDRALNDLLSFVQVVPHQTGGAGFSPAGHSKKVTRVSKLRRKALEAASLQHNTSQ